MRIFKKTVWNSFNTYIVYFWPHCIPPNLRVEFIIPHRFVSKPHRRYSKILKICVMNGSWCYFSWLVGRVSRWMCLEMQATTLLQQRELTANRKMKTEVADKNPLLKFNVIFFFASFLFYLLMLSIVKTDLKQFFLFFFFFLNFHSF